MWELLQFWCFYFHKVHMTRICGSLFATRFPCWASSVFLTEDDGRLPSRCVLSTHHLSRIFWKAAFCSNLVIRHYPWWSSRGEINFKEKKISTSAWKDLYSYLFGKIKHIGVKTVWHSAAETYLSLALHLCVLLADGTKSAQSGGKPLTLLGRWSYSHHNMWRDKEWWGVILRLRGVDSRS